MRRLSFLALMMVTLIGVSSRALAQNNPYTVSIGTTDWWWADHDNWFAALQATVYYNGSPLPDSGNYFFTWYIYQSVLGKWVVTDGQNSQPGGYGGDTASPETSPQNYFYAYVTVTDSHVFGPITSPYTQQFTFPYTGESDGFGPIDQNGLGVGGVTPNHWRWTIN